MNVAYEEEDLLSTEELLLLELLTYYTEPDGDVIYESEDCYPGITVEQYLKSDLSKCKDYTESCSAGMNMHDMEQIRDAILNPGNEKFETIRNMKIMELHTDTAEGGGEGKSILFVSEETGEAVVAFRGTEKDEWPDNFYGGGATLAKDGVSTPQQENALAWYKEIYKEYGLEDYYVTLTGHSKGDNKATYTTILDDTVDRCVGYDGQGMSDEFMWVYAEEIVARQGCIEHHNVNYDFVNPLLNVIGKSTYYEGENVDSFVENHSPNSLLKFGENGKVTMADVVDRPYEMEVIDRFLNSYLRSLNGEDKEILLSIIASFIQGKNNNADGDYYKEVLLDIENFRVMVDFVGYTSRYMRENPKLYWAIQSFLVNNDMGNLNFLISSIENSATVNFIHTLVDAVSNSGISFLDGNVVEILEELDLAHGTDLDANIILQIKETIMNNLHQILKLLDGIFEKLYYLIAGTADIINYANSSFCSSGGKNHFYVSTTHLHDGICFLEEASLHVDKAYKNLAGISLYGINDTSVRNSLEDIKYQLNQENRECDELTKGLIGIKRIYELEEQQL